MKQSSGGNTVEYSHDRFGRVTAEKRSVGGYGTYAFLYAYNGDGMRPHAVTEVENADGAIPGDALNTVFNDFGKIQMIEDEGKGLRMDFTYGPDRERWSSELSRASTTTGMTVYAGDYERVMENGAVRDFYYLDGNTIAVRENGELKIYLAFTDNLGSILSVIDEDGNKVFNASYDPWGKQTVQYNKIGLHLGYTGHEMLTEFDIINMNGRLYDPVLGRFFSPDNYVQMPDNSQSFNRYSYCLNNPLKYTDPSGEFWNIVIGAAIGGVFNWASHGFKFNANGLGYFLTGAVSSGVSVGVASGVNVAMAGGNFWTGAACLAKGIEATGAIAWAATGACSGFASGFILSAGNSWIEGHGFGKGLLAGLKSGGVNALADGIIGGLEGGFDAMDKGTNFWTGTGYFDTSGALACQGCKPKDFNIGDKIKAKYVGKFEKQRVFETKKLGSLSGRYAAFTLPDIGIFAGEGVFSSGQLNGLVMMQHEFGHILQFRKVGAEFYYKVIALESALNCNGIWPYNGIPHDEYWTETWANYLSKQYFGERWFGMEMKIKKRLDFYYPSENVSKSFLWQKCLLYNIF